MNKIMNDIFIYGGIGIILLVFISFWGFYWAIFPIKITSNITPDRFNLKYEHITLKTKDNLHLDAWYIPAKHKTNNAIIILHGYPADKGDVLPSTIFLHDKFNLLYIDFRHFGKSEGLYSTIGKYEVLDLLSAVDYLHLIKKMSGVGVWGFSMGGAVALMGAEQSSLIKAIVVESPYARLDWIAEEYFKIPLLRYPLSKLVSIWGSLFLDLNISTVSPAEAAKKLNIPVFLIYSKSDPVIPSRHGYLIEKNLKKHPESKVMIFDNKDHGAISASINKEISQFFEDNVD